MRKIPRVRERTATPAELEEDRRRCLAAKVKPPTLAPIEGNLCGCVVMFAQWRRCCCCGSLTLFVNSQARSDSDFECGLCQGIRESHAQRLRQSLPTRAALQVRALCAMANGNREVAYAS